MTAAGPGDVWTVHFLHRPTNQLLTKTNSFIDCLFKLLSAVIVNSNFTGRLRAVVVEQDQNRMVRAVSRDVDRKRHTGGCLDGQGQDRIPARDPLIDS